MNTVGRLVDLRFIAVADVALATRSQADPTNVQSVAPFVCGLCSKPFKNELDGRTCAHWVEKLLQVAPTAFRRGVSRT